MISNRRRFSITDPNDEEIDTANKTLGDVNAITSVANSNKTESTIGKFGVGFKAVFQYTSTPHIYDVDFSFKIEHYIMPVRLEDDHPERGSMETLFVFPFDNPDIDRERAEQEIADKLAALTLPTLFLKNLQCIEYDHGSGNGSYTKTIETKLNADSVTIEQIRMWQYHFGVDGKAAPPQNFLMFTKTEHIDGYNADLSIGFAVDDKNKLTPTAYNAFCFFPTKEKTGLNFIIHAPFLLTDSLEGIRANSDFNRTLIQKLAELSATALIHLKGAGLIDDDILKIIPCDPNAFTDLDSREQISFRPFYDEIKKTFRTEEILPTIISKKYVISSNAYWATTSKLSQLFSNEQLKILTGEPKAMWAFTSVSERHVGGGAINRYVKDLVEKSFEDENLLPLITAEFIERQKINWLHDFYSYLTETAPRMKLTRSLPIFLNQDKKAAAAFDANGRATLFMPMDGVEGYATVYRELLKDKEIAQCLEKFGIRPPSLKDEIYNKILPLYRSADEFDTRPHIRTFLRYCLEVSFAARERLVEDLRHYKFVFVKTLDGKISRCRPGEAYFYSTELAQYFQGVPEIYFVHLDDYEQFIPKRAHEALKIFLRAVGIAFGAPRLRVFEIDRDEAERLKLPCHNEQREIIWTENRIDGCQEVLKIIAESQDKNKSLVLWKVLLKVFIYRRTLEKELVGRAQPQDISRRRMRNREFPSTDIAALRQTPWLLDTKGQFHAPNALDTSTLSKEYDRKSEDAERLIKFLKISDVSNLTEEQRRKLRLAELIEQKYSPAEIKELINRKEKKSASPPPEPSPEPLTPLPLQSPPPPSTTLRAEPTTIKNKPEDPAKEIENLTKKYEEELQKLNQKAELMALAEAAQKYSYEWFTTLLDLEKLNSDASDSREISIGFGRVERDLGTRRTLILKYPNRYIPRKIEELTDIKLQLSSRGEKIAEPIIDAISIKSFTLRVKIKDIDKLSDVNLAIVNEAKIEAKSPVFLLDALINSFKSLALEPTFDMKSNLPSNIQFIFGPPGTGKTTYLAREILIPLMRQTGSARILVLTPTNKAADVLAGRIISLLDAVNDQSYCDWLIRFVMTNDELIEQRGVRRDRTFNITRLERSITVTTVARFPYDYFIAGDKRLPLQ